MSKITSRPDGSSTIVYDLGSDDSFIGFSCQRDDPGSPKCTVEGEIKGANPYDLMGMVRGIAESLDNLIENKNSSDLPSFHRVNISKFQTLCKHIVAEVEAIMGPPSNEASLSLGDSWEEADAKLSRGKPN